MCADVAPVRPTWSSTPHPPAEDFADSCATTRFLPAPAASDCQGEAGLTYKPHRDRSTISRLTWAVSPAAGIGLPGLPLRARRGMPGATTDPDGCHDIDSNPVRARCQVPGSGTWRRSGSPADRANHPG